MICEKILGNEKQIDLSGKKIEYVDIEWDEAFKKIHKKTTNLGREIGIRLDDTVLTTGMSQGDILYLDDTSAIVVDIKPCDVIRIRIDQNHGHMIPKLCYDIGNRHAPLFYGEDNDQFITPYNEPMLQMILTLHGVSAEKETMKLNFHRRISSAVHKHQH